jgi:hypothetical protein
MTGRLLSVRNCGHKFLIILPRQVIITLAGMGVLNFSPY